MKGLGQAIYEDGRIEGKAEERAFIVKSMHKKGMPLEQIAEIVGISTEEVEKIIQMEILWIYLKEILRANKS